jgi:hypothetical protein
MIRSFKIFILALTVLPAVSLLLFWPMMLWTSTGPDGEGVFGTVYLAWAGGAVYYYSFGVSAFYLVHASKRSYLKDQMLAWAVLFLFFGILTQPVYWYLHIWREPPALR